MSNISKIHHASLIIANTDKSLAFYCDSLGLTQDLSRPNLGYPGAWLNVGGEQIHLLELPNPDPTENRPVHGGRDRHIAFSVVDLKQVIEQLNKIDVVYTLSKSGRQALFCRDPDGNGLEFIEI